MMEQRSLKLQEVSTLKLYMRQIQRGYVFNNDHSRQVDGPKMGLGPTLCPQLHRTRLRGATSAQFATIPSCVIDLWVRH